MARATQNAQALDAFIARKVEIDAMLARLAALSAAAQRPERIALPLPESLRGGAAAKVVSAMIAKGLIEEVEVNLWRGEAIWRESGGQQ